MQTWTKQQRPSPDANGTSKIRQSKDNPRPPPWGPVRLIGLFNQCLTADSPTPASNVSIWALWSAEIKDTCTLFDSSYLYGYSGLWRYLEWAAHWKLRQAREPKRPGVPFAQPQSVQDPKTTTEYSCSYRPAWPSVALLTRPIAPNVPSVGSFYHFRVLYFNATIQPKIDRTTHHRHYRHIRFERRLSCLPFSLLDLICLRPRVFCLIPSPSLSPTVPSARSPDSRTGGEGQEEQAQLCKIGRRSERAALLSAENGHQIHSTHHPRLTQKTGPNSSRVSSILSGLHPGRLSRLSLGPWGRLLLQALGKFVFGRRTKTCQTTPAGLTTPDQAPGRRGTAAAWCHAICHHAACDPPLQIRWYLAGVASEKPPNTCHKHKKTHDGIGHLLSADTTCSRSRVAVPDLLRALLVLSGLLRVKQTHQLCQLEAFRWLLFRVPSLYQTPLQRHPRFAGPNLSYPALIRQTTSIMLGSVSLRPKSASGGLFGQAQATMAASPTMPSPGPQKMSKTFFRKFQANSKKGPPGPSFPSPAGPVWGNIAVPARADGRGLAVISCSSCCRGARIRAILSAPDNGEGDFVRVPCRRAKQNAPAKLHAANDYHGHGEDAGVICSCSALLLSFGPSVGRIFRGPANFDTQSIQWSTSQSQTFRDPVISPPTERWHTRIRQRNEHHRKVKPVGGSVLPPSHWADGDPHLLVSGFWKSRARKIGSWGGGVRRGRLTARATRYTPPGTFRERRAPLFCWSAALSLEVRASFAHPGPWYLSNPLRYSSLPSTYSTSNSTRALTMASKRDMRRPDLIVPYQEPKAKGDSTELSSTLSSTLPMAAMLTRNKFIGCETNSIAGAAPSCGGQATIAQGASVVFSIQTWLGESEETKKSSATPGYFSVGMSVMALAVSYLPLFLPPPAQRGAATGTGPAAPVPPA
ncbi:uncharacterized protein CLUP02_14678 [Colletotrichum lupini]|uniref:Uncharacterized protein n=1 Tax=Colletotrichum lupini TaxID=145971 RepID=A0A9Q8WNI8_9PEZI|nr:uncharacterized protein CLUP02_14678 [Colletotrichum lupini]UQC89150.1 hypothetical protein CLUP02_14678 [Colletotrichum lupini]